MFNLCYGMRHIYISQLPYSDFSHPNGALDLAGEDAGISLWFSQGRWKCIAGPWGNGTYFFTAVNPNGDPERVMCADGQQRVVTIALTHSNQIYTRNTVGEIYYDGDRMYEEGMNGQATGNHIHCEVAAGVQTTKYYDKEMGVYRMPMELNPVELFFVNDSFSDVIYDHGTSLPHCTSLEYTKEEPMEEETIIERISYANKKIVGTVDGNRFGTMYDRTVLAGFSDKGLIADGGKELICVNGSIFYTWDGACYAEGLEKSRGINNQSNDMSCVYKFAEVMAIAFRKDGTIVFDKQKNILANLASYYGAITGAFGVMKDGEACFWGSELDSSRAGCFSVRSGRTIIGRSSTDKELIIISIPGITGQSGPTGEELLQICRDAGCTDAICLDGGGSRKLRVNGQVLVDLGRSIKNAVLFYEMPGEPANEEEDPTDTDNDALSEAQERNKELLAENTDLKVENAKLKKILQQIKEMATWTN